ncbi:MAG: inositol monophosphatase, partial [Gammaproteobacteria bacterium]|nr:inositol monophosphatase [Gammaproteobacteria bacterium]
GHIIAEHSKRPTSVQRKQGGNTLASQVITEVDLLSQAIILKTLLPTCKNFDLALLTEEASDDKMRLEKDYFWCIDPLDGTLPFIDKTSGYAVSIALVSRSGKSLIGIIYDPFEQTLYHAVRGMGAFRNKKKWALKHGSHIKKEVLTIVSDRSFLQQKNYTRTIQSLELIATTLGFSGLKQISHGGAAMNACWVLENSPACYFKFPKKENGGGSLWDYAATSCLFDEIGAVASHINGKSLELNRQDSTFMNHQGILYTSHQEIAANIQALFQDLH